MKILVQAFLVDELEQEYIDIEFTEANSQQDDIEMKIGEKRFWIRRKDLKFIDYFLKNS